MAIATYYEVPNMMSLRDAMNRLVDGSVVQSDGEQQQSARLPVDVYETDNEYIVRASVPGVSPESVQISVVEGTVSIQAERKEPEISGECLLHERYEGSFSRRLTFPTPLNADGATAEYDNGVLTLTLPKAEFARPKQISVSTKSSSPQQESQTQSSKQQ